MATQTEAPMQFLTYGPRRAIGVSYVGPLESAKMTALWHDQFLPRVGEIAKPAGAAAFGFCRCVAGAPQGTMEYVAAMDATPDAPVPAGMIAIDVPRADYAVFKVAGLGDIGATWGRAIEQVNANPAWEPYCGPKGCQCATHPCFELYPPDFNPDGGTLFIYIPVKKAK